MKSSRMGTLLFAAAIEIKRGDDHGRILHVFARWRQFRAHCAIVLVN